MTTMFRPLAAVVFLAACSQMNNSGEAGSIEGTIAGSGQALTVSVPGSSNSTTTDAMGAFVLTEVEAGTSELHVSGGADDATSRYA